MKKLCFWIILITVIGMLPSLLQYGCFVLTTDMVDQEVPFIILAGAKWADERLPMSKLSFWAYTIYDNKYYIPMGFTYDSHITQGARAYSLVHKMGRYPKIMPPDHLFKAQLDTEGVAGDTKKHYLC